MTILITAAKKATFPYKGIEKANFSLLFPTPAVINMQNSFLRLRILSLSFKISTRVTSQSFPKLYSVGQSLRSSAKKVKSIHTIPT